MDSAPAPQRSKFWIWADRVSLVVLLAIGVWFVCYMYYCLPYFTRGRGQPQAQSRSEPKTPEPGK